MVVAIPLGNGGEALIDREDLPLVSSYHWTRVSDARALTSYAVGWVEGRRVYLHRWLTGATTTIDHVNGNGLDNRRQNLREVTPAQNGANRRTGRNSSSGIRGVCWHVGKGQWSARCQVRGVRLHLGYFDTKEAAAVAVQEAWHEHYGEYAPGAVR